MQKKTIALAIVASLGLGASLAIGGAHATFGFYISPSNGYSRYANGSVGEVRADPDPTAMVECGTNSSAGYCTFIKNGEYSYCYTTDAAQMDVMRAMHDGSFFSVSWLEQTAACNYVLQYTSSRTMPKGQ
jgi:hypothetical protein